MTRQVDIVDVRDVGSTAIALDITTPDGFTARPGQFVKLASSINGEEESRFYSISSPDVEETFEVTIKIDPEGTLGPWLANQQAGQTVSLAGPFGNTYYEDEDRVVLLAGGPGVGPAVGIAERALSDGNQAAIVYRDDTIIHADRLEALREQGAFVAVLNTEDSLTKDVEAAITGGGQVYVYGFADFLDAAIDALAAAGGDPEHAKVENFG